MHSVEGGRNGRRLCTSTRTPPSVSFLCAGAAPVVAWLVATRCHALAPRGCVGSRLPARLDGVCRFASAARPPSACKCRGGREGSNQSSLRPPAMERAQCALGARRSSESC